MFLHGRKWFFFYAFLWLALGFLAVHYFQGTRWLMLYGGTIHKLSRLHLLTVHLTVGCLLVLAAFEGFLFFKNEEAKNLALIRARFHHLAHICTLSSLFSGLTMEMIEHYPNPLIADHLRGALIAYVCLIGFSLLCHLNFLGRWRCVGAVGFALVVLNAAHLGGVVQKGSMFFN